MDELVKRLMSEYKMDHATATQMATKMMALKSSIIRGKNPATINAEDVGPGDIHDETGAPVALKPQNRPYLADNVGPDHMAVLQNQHPGDEVLNKLNLTADLERGKRPGGYRLDGLGPMGIAGATAQALGNMQLQPYMDPPGTPISTYSSLMPPPKSDTPELLPLGQAPKFGWDAKVDMREAKADKLLTLAKPGPVLGMYAAQNGGGPMGSVQVLTDYLRAQRKKEGDPWAWASTGPEL